MPPLSLQALLVLRILKHGLRNCSAGKGRRERLGRIATDAIYCARITLMGLLRIEATVLKEHTNLRPAAQVEGKRLSHN